MTFPKEITEIDILTMATTLCSKYDEWKKYDDVMDILDINTNSFCKKMKSKFPNSDEKILQSITLTYYLILFMICNDKIENIQLDEK